MARKTAEQVIKTRALLIDTARLSFLDDGIAHVSLEQIANRAGMTRGSIYSQFPEGKTGLLKAVYSDLDARVEEWLTNSPPPSLSGGEALKQFIEDWLISIHQRGWLRQKIELRFQMILQDDDIFACKGKDRFLGLIDKTQKLIEQAQEQKDISNFSPPLLLATQLVSMFVGLTVIWHHMGWDKSRIDEGEKALRLWLKQVMYNDGVKV